MLERQLHRPNGVAREGDPGIKRVQLGDIELLIWQDVRLRRRLLCRFLLLLPRGSFAGSCAGWCLDQDAQIIQIQGLRVQIGDYCGPLGAQLQGHVALDIAVADCALQRNEVPALLFLLVRDLTPKLVRWRPGQRELEELA
jgi:hypothetical protein